MRLRFHILILLFGVGALAKATPKEVCLIAKTEFVDGRDVPQRGVRVLEDEDGALTTEFIHHGGRPFGDSKFEDRLRARLLALPAKTQDWNRLIDTCSKRVEIRNHIHFGVLDGSKACIMIDFHGRRVAVNGYNPALTILRLREEDTDISALAQLLDEIALEIGREEMAL